MACCRRKASGHLGFALGAPRVVLVFADRHANRSARAACRGRWLALQWLKYVCNAKLGGVYRRLSAYIGVCI